MAAPKITDVAKLAGVSTATVSRALNQPNTVAEPTRTAVVEAAAKAGYRINLAARNLRRQRAGAAVVLVPNLGNPFFSEILSGIEATLAAAGLGVLVADTKHPGVPADLVVDYLYGGRADGIISLDGSLPTLLATTQHHDSPLPPVIYACEWNAKAGAPSVRSDNFKGARLAMGHLYDLGHRRIAHVTGPADNILTIVRRDAFIAARSDHDLPALPGSIIQGDFSLRSGRDAAQQILCMDRDDWPSAVFCASDEMAFGLIAGLHGAGVKVPDDMSVVGFDDIEPAEYFLPSLTTIRQDRLTLGRKAAELLLRRLDGKQNGQNSGFELIDVDLIVRDSTSSPR